MKLQKATRCALFAVLELARDPNRQMSASDIAEKYDISSNHLAKVLRDLGRAGLVESVRGAGGGYKFSGKAKRDTLYDVIALFEDVGANCHADPEEGDGTAVGQALCQVTREIDTIAEATLRSITIETLLRSMRHDEASAAEQKAG